MVKYFLNVGQSGKSDDMEGNVTYKFDLETPLRFPFRFGDGGTPTWVNYKSLEIKTSQKEDEIFRDTDGKGGIGNRFSPIEHYWNLCVPDDKRFSYWGYDDKLILDDTERNIYLELLHFPHSTLKIKPVEITWKGDKNIRLKLASPYSVRDETQNFNIEINEINLESQKVDQLHSLITNDIEKGQNLTLKLSSPNKTYFRKDYQGINALVIPENSLQEDLTTQNSNSSPFSNKYFVIFVLGVIILISFFLFFLIIRSEKSRKK